MTAGTLLTPHHFSLMQGPKSTSKVLLDVIFYMFNFNLQSLFNKQTIYIMFWRDIVGLQACLVITPMPILLELFLLFSNLEAYWLAPLPFQKLLELVKLLTVPLRSYTEVTLKMMFISKFHHC
ncbi:hypothetical protein ACJX0J_024261 [Zea mays]